MTEDKRPRVLFVDDEADLLHALRRALRRREQQWNLLFAQSAEDALRLCRIRPCQVVVTDLLMPGINGIELIRLLNDEFPATQCMMLSGTAGLDDAAEAINTTRIFRFFSKPCDTLALSSSIEDALDAVHQRSEPPTIERLMQSFSLTRSEARLTRSLVMGNALDAAAEALGITESSARTYLKRVFSKTGCSRQAELVSKVLRRIQHTAQ
jgi:DNA-binding NarL/FixJ family response regulator